MKENMEENEPKQNPIVPPKGRQASSTPGKVAPEGAEKEGLLDGSLGEIQENASDEELEFMSDTSAAMLIRTPRGGRLLIYTVLLALLSGIIWANLAVLDEITRGIGSVVPS